MMMYAAAIRLRYTQPGLQRDYRVPGGNAGMWAVGGIGFLAVLFSFAVTFFPPSQLPVGSPAIYTTARRLRHGAVPRRPHRHQHRDGPPARQRPPYLKRDAGGSFRTRPHRSRPLPQRFRIAPSAVTRSVTSRSRPSSSSTSYQSPSGVSTKSAPSIPNAA